MRPAWDEVDIAGDLAGGDCTATFHRSGHTVAVATIGRDRESLQAKVELENCSQARALELAERSSCSSLAKTLAVQRRHLRRQLDWPIHRRH
jgi:hypothetical protein